MMFIVLYFKSRNVQVQKYKVQLRIFLSMPEGVPFDASVSLTVQRKTHSSCLLGTLIFLAILILFVVGLSLRIKETVTKQNLKWISSPTAVSPSSLNLTCKVHEKNPKSWMFSIQSIGQDLNDAERYFDIKVYKLTTEYSTVIKNESVSMVPCTKQHWNLPELSQTFDRMKFSQGLCPEIGTRIPLKGSFTSPVFESTLIDVVPCDPSKNNKTYQCMPQDPNRTMPFVLDVFSLKAVINPYDSSLIRHVLSDRDYMSFYLDSRRIDKVMNLYFSNYDLQLDQNMAFSIGYQHQNGIGALVNAQRRSDYLGEGSGASYVQIYLRRDFLDHKVIIQYGKIANAFGQMGGLLQVVIAIFIGVKIFNSAIMSARIGSKMFRSSSSKTIRLKQWYSCTCLKEYLTNIWTFIKDDCCCCCVALIERLFLCCSCLFSCVWCCLQWIASCFYKTISCTWCKSKWTDHPQQFDGMVEQTEYYLDIQRILFNLETLTQLCILKFGPNEFMLAQSRNNLTITEARKRRKVEQFLDRKRNDLPQEQADEQLSSQIAKLKEHYKKICPNLNQTELNLSADITKDQVELARFLVRGMCPKIKDYLESNDEIPGLSRTNLIANDNMESHHEPSQINFREGSIYFRSPI